MTKYYSTSAMKARQNALLERKRPVKTFDHENHKWLRGRFSEYEFSPDARFESMLQYPKKRSLYRKHVDIGRDYQKKQKFYNNWQRLTEKETGRRAQHVQERFTHLLNRTVTSGVSLTESLKYSYHSWLNKTGKSIEFEKLFETKAPTPQQVISVHANQVCSGEDDNVEEVEIEEGEGVDVEEKKVEEEGERRQWSVTEDVDVVKDSAKRLSSHRSISVDNLPRVVDDFRIRQTDVLNRLIKSLTSLSVQDLTYI